MITTGAGPEAGGGQQDGQGPGHRPYHRRGHRGAQGEAGGEVALTVTVHNLTQCCRMCARVFSVSSTLCTQAAPSTGAAQYSTSRRLRST